MIRSFPGRLAAPSNGLSAKTKRATVVGWDQLMCRSISGISARAVAGPLAFYVRGEYQHAPGIPAYGTSVLNAIAKVDAAGTDLGAALTSTTPGTKVDGFTMLDGYVAVMAKGYQFSF